jgi:hypothetical protein
MSARGQSAANSEENKRPSNSPPPPSSGPAPASQPSNAEDEDDDFVDISDEDTDMRDADADDKRAQNTLGLHRLAANSEDIDDDSDDEPDGMANHPLLSMLTGRLGNRRRGSTHQWDRLHPVTSVLSVYNVDDCTELENEAFPENERCSREKACILYHCDALCAFLQCSQERLFMVTCSSVSPTN